MSFIILIKLKLEEASVFSKSELSRFILKYTKYNIRRSTIKNVPKTNFFFRLRSIFVKSSEKFNINIKINPSFLIQQTALVHSIEKIISKILY